MLDELDQIEQLKIVFLKGLKDENPKHHNLIKGLSQFILGKFYKRLQKQYSETKMPKALSVKIKAIFNVINNIQQ